MESLQLKVKYNYFCQISNIVLIALKLDLRAINKTVLTGSHTEFKIVWSAYVGNRVLGWLLGHGLVDKGEF